MEGYGQYIDYVPEYNIYNKQKVETYVDAAIQYALRSIYCRESLLPQVPNLFIDLERFKHALDSYDVLLHIKNHVEIALSSILKEYNPEISMEYNTDTNMLLYEIDFKGEGTVQIVNGQSLLRASIKINKKKFYE